MINKADKLIVINLKLALTQYSASVELSCTDMH